MGMGLQPTYIVGMDKGLMTNKKPFLLPDKAFSKMSNAYVWRERIKRREGNQILGRLRRDLTSITLSTQANGATYTNADILADPSINVRAPALPTVPETNAQIAPGTVSITVGAVTFTDSAAANGILVGTPGTNNGTINYNSGALTLNFSPALGGATNVVITFSYYPALPGMGTWQKILATSAIDSDQTIWFDQKYAYIYTGANFQELAPGTTWNGTDSDFFLCYNAVGSTPDSKVFFATNFVCDSLDPIRYYDGSWHNFAPLTTATTTMFQARILVSYYGRLLALNTWEGTTAGGYGAAKNIYNRCRFSQQYGNVLDQNNAWLTDVFGRGGVIDAPTNESIISALFIKNTLVVTFETTTWQLRYVGEYGLPFIWERVSVDFGSDSTFSTVIFENHMLSVGDKGIVAANAIGVNRIDLDIPDTVFSFQSANNGDKRIWGVRDYFKELVFWNYPDSNTQAAPGVSTTYPNSVMVYNYRNNTWAQFRDNVTCFGTWQSSNAITWDRTDIFWDDEIVTWDSVDTEAASPIIVSTNQQGFVHRYGVVSSLANGQQASLQVTSITITASGSLFTVQLTSPNHNLQDSEIIFLQELNFTGTSAGSKVALTCSLNNSLFQVKIVDVNTVNLLQWNFTSNSYTSNFPVTFTPNVTATYQGGGVMSLIPKLDVQTKDFNLYQAQSLGMKLSFIDFLMSPTNGSAFTVNIYIDTSLTSPDNASTGNVELGTNLDAPYYYPAADIAPFRYYATLNGYFYRIQMTYDDTLMNTLATHTNYWECHGIKTWTRPGGRAPW